MKIFIGITYLYRCWGGKYLVGYIGMICHYLCPEEFIGKSKFFCCKWYFQREHFCCKSNRCARNGYEAFGVTKLLQMSFYNEK